MAHAIITRDNMQFSWELEDEDGFKSDYAEDRYSKGGYDYEIDDLSDLAEVARVTRLGGNNELKKLQYKFMKVDHGPQRIIGSESNTKINEGPINTTSGSSNTARSRQCSKVYSPRTQRQIQTERSPLDFPIVKCTCAAPRVYRCKDYYKNRKEERLRQTLEEERKMREFRSRPAPKFEFVPISLGPSKNKKGNKKRRKRSTPRIVKVEPVVVEEQQTGRIQMRPFPMHSEKRMLERKKYDQDVQDKMAQKRLEQERERRKMEEKQYKDMRKLTEFKAKPNPFKTPRTLRK